MTVGFEAYNDAGKLQFDSNSSAFALVGSGSIIAKDIWFVPGSGFVDDYDPSTGIPGAYYDGTYPLTANQATLPSNTEMVAFMNTGDHWGSPIWGKRASGGFYATYETQPCTYLMSGVPRSNLDSHLVNWFAFTSMRNLSPSAHNAGLQIFNSDGSLSWDSSRRPLLVTGSGNYAPSSYPNTTSVGGSPGAIIALDYFAATSRHSSIEYRLGFNGNSIGEYAYKSGVGSGNSAMIVPLSGGYRFLGVHSLSLS
ncbi:MAG: hypothetical protein ACTHJR_11585 [Sphingomonas sp.]|uniref:hypothetical protein n=1 Tax=Sphingomonas sp. TaxID=28214 RepID=UPI003F7ED46A